MLLLLLGVLVSFNCHADESIEEIARGLRHNSYSDIKNCADLHVKNCEIKLAIGLVSGVLINKGQHEDLVEAKEILENGTMNPKARFLLGLIYIKYYHFSYKGGSLVASSCREGLEEACYYIMKNIQEYDDNCKDRSCYSLIYAVGQEIKFLDDLDESKISQDYKRQELPRYNTELAIALAKRGNKKAVALLENAVEENYFDAFGVLAHIYEQGVLVPKDLERAYMLYDLEGRVPTNPAKENVARQLSVEQLKSAKNASWNWQKSHNSYRPGYPGRASASIQFING